jgi:hypothetical protein
MCLSLFFSFPDGFGAWWDISTKDSRTGLRMRASANVCFLGVVADWYGWKGKEPRQHVYKQLTAC